MNDGKQGKPVMNKFNEPAEKGTKREAVRVNICRGDPMAMQSPVHECAFQPENSVSGVDCVIRRIAFYLSSNQHVRAVILVGSYARGDVDAHSDIDLVVITDTAMRRSELYSMLPDDLKIRELSLLPYASATFEALYKEGSLFVAHVLREGCAVYDDGYYANLRDVPFEVSRDSLLLEWQILKQEVSLCANLSIYGEVFVGCLSHIYSITKNVAIVILALQGELVFNKDAALQRLRSRFPDLEADVSDLAKLEPFSTSCSKGLPVKQPFSPVRCRNRVELCVNRLNKIISRVEPFERD